MNRSTRGALERLQNHLDSVAGKLSHSFADASENHAGTPEAVAHAREEALRKVMRRYFPLPFKVGKGAIYDSFGARSMSMDCVICSSNHPLLSGEDGNIETLLVDGVFAALELKPDLTDLPVDFGDSRKPETELLRGLRQARSVKQLRRTTGAILSPGKKSPELVDYSHRCPTYLIADRSASIQELAKYVADWYLRNDIPPAEQVDVIYVLNEGLILNSKCPDHNHTIPTAGSWYPHLAVYKSGTEANTQFLLTLATEIPPELSMSEPVISRYLKKIPMAVPFTGFKTIKGAYRSFKRTPQSGAA